MYNISNTRRLISKRPLTTQTRLLSTTNNVRKGGFSKILLGTLFVSAAGFAYYQKSQKDQHFYQGDSDPYEKTKKNVSELGHDIANDGSVKSKAQGAADELNYAGKHIKNSAQLAGQAAQDAFTHVEKDGKSVANSFKNESRDLKNDIKNESRDLKNNIKNDTDKFLAEHHLKEGDYSPEHVLSQNHDPNQAAFKAANKFKETKENVSNEVDKDLNKAKNAYYEKKGEAKATAEHVKEEGKSFWSSIFGSNDSKKTADNDVIVAGVPASRQKKVSAEYDYPQHNTEHNPMVHEKLSTDKTKPDWETSLEDHAKHVVHDTTTLVDKDTEKVKKMWDAKKRSGVVQESSWFGNATEKVSELEHKAANEVHEKADEAKSKWEGLKNKVGITTHDVKKDAENSWENVKDKASYEAERVKSNVNSSAEDLSNKAKRETNKVASDVNKTAQDIKNEGARLTRKASDGIQDLHQEVSANAEKLKKQGEQTAKSWYEKGTEQVKSGFETVKNVADKDLQWAEDKVQDTYADAKDEVNRLFGVRNEKQEGLRGHVYRGEKFAEEEEGNLRGTRRNTKLKPAAVVVEEAHSKDL